MLVMCNHLVLNVEWLFHLSFHALKQNRGGINQELEFELFLNVTFFSLVSDISIVVYVYISYLFASLFSDSLYP